MNCKSSLLPFNVKGNCKSFLNLHLCFGTCKGWLQILQVHRTYILFYMRETIMSTGTLGQESTSVC